LGGETTAATKARHTAETQVGTRYPIAGFVVDSPRKPAPRGAYESEVWVVQIPANSTTGTSETSLAKRNSETQSCGRGSILVLLLDGKTRGRE